MKRNGGILAFLTIMFSTFVSAGPVEGVEQLLRGLNEVVVILIQFIGDIILDINSFDEFLFAKILLFTLILIITYTVIKQNNLLGGTKNKPVQWIISVSVSTLAIRYLSDDFIQAIMLQYGALAVGITVFLPLMIYFFFIHQSGIGPFGRRAGWVVFAISFFALWSFRYDDLGQANVIYWIAIGFVAIALLFDKTIHEYFGMSQIRKARDTTRVERRASAEHRLSNAKRAYEEGHISEREYEKLRDKFERIIRSNI